MAKAIYHKHQRVFVRPVGTWALVEQVKPQWVKDVEEPVQESRPGLKWREANRSNLMFCRAGRHRPHP
jgi:hypothetical protein